MQVEKTAEDVKDLHSPFTVRILFGPPEILRYWVPLATLGWHIPHSPGVTPVQKNTTSRGDRWGHFCRCCQLRGQKKRLHVNLLRFPMNPWQVRLKDWSWQESLESCQAFHFLAWVFMTIHCWPTRFLSPLVGINCSIFRIKEVFFRGSAWILAFRGHQ